MQKQMKYTKRSKRISQIIVALTVLTVAALILSGSSLFAKNYVNWENEYYFQIPDDWRQVERYNVEEFLRFHGKDPASVPHDAFFCPKDADPFWSKAYLFVSTEKSENSFAQADSLLLGLATEFDKMVYAQDSLGPITSVKSQKPKLDRQARTITQVSNLNVQGVKQVMRLVMKFHRSGITTFYIYSQAELYKTYVPTFVEMVNSFSDENLSDAAEGDAVVIVDVAEQESASSATAKKSAETSANSGFSGFYKRYSSYLGLAFFLIAYIIYIRMRRRSGAG